MEKPARILVSGASGLIGTSLVRAFAANRISVTHLVRAATLQNQQEIRWSPYTDPALADAAQLEGFDAVIHLSGANIGRRWTAAYKQEIVRSRVQTTQALAKLLARLQHPPKVFLCASAIGIYGSRGDAILKDDAPPGTGFLAETCSAWETAASPAKEAGIRAAHLRFGVVLAREGGALARMLPLFRLGLGGKLGSGEQWMSWIAMPDLVSAVFYILEAEELSGTINMTAPAPVTNAEFTQMMAHILHRPAIFPVPAFVLRLAFGEMADETLLASARVLPEKLLSSGFRFAYPELSAALKTLLEKS